MSRPIRAGLTFFALVLLAVGLSVVLPYMTVSASGIPPEAQRHRAQLVREARFQFGLDAPVSTLAAQIHQESRWNSSAVSPAGAQGLAQFMPSTAAWMPKIDRRTGEPLPFNPAWAMRALCSYDKWLLDRVRGATLCDRWHFALAAYNGGLGWVQRDQRMTAEAGLDPLQWQYVRLFNAGRSAANFRENRGYAPRILGPLTNLYRVAGWGKGGCNVD